MIPPRPAPGTPPLPWVERSAHGWWLVGLLWLECALIWLVTYRHALPLLAFQDPDDALRLQEVRDWLAGQSWFDVDQHRIYPPYGGPMHWSRLVDIPLAALIVLLRPLLGQAPAEILACTLVPLFTLGALCAALYAALRPFLGAGRAALGVLLVVTIPSVTSQMVPLRIDHHGWQIVMAALLLSGLLHPDARRGGWIMGGAMALWLQISSEGLPYAALAGGVLTLRQTVRADDAPRLDRYVYALAGGSALLLLAVHGRAMVVPHCDAMSPVYLAPLLLLALLLPLGRRLLGAATPVRRLVPPLVAGLAAAALFRFVGDACLDGPFRQLSPFVYQYWYRNVAEGMPVWTQSPDKQIGLIAPVALGLLGQMLALRAERAAQARFAWASLFALTLGSTVVAALVYRATSVACLFALTGSLWLIARAYPVARRQPAALSRILLTVALAALTPVGATAIAIAVLHQVLPAQTVQDDSSTDPARISSAPLNLRALNALPPATLLTPLDLGPAVLVQTHHRVIGTSHHRNGRGIEAVMRTFLSPADKVQALLRATPATHVLFAADLNETHAYRTLAPHGLAADLAGGRPPRWLVPVPLHGAGSLRLYRIVPTHQPDRPGRPNRTAR